MAALKRYVIVRDIPDIHEKNQQELGSISAASCTALGKAGHGRVQWQHSYVAEGKTFCIYLAESEEAIQEHAKHGRLSPEDAQQQAALALIADVCSRALESCCSATDARAGLKCEAWQAGDGCDVEAALAQLIAEAAAAVQAQ